MWAGKQLKISGFKILILRQNLQFSVIFPKSTSLQLPTDHLVHQSVIVLNKSFIFIRANCLTIMNTFDIGGVLAQLTVAEKVELLQVRISGIRSLSHVSAYPQSASLMDPTEHGGLDSSMAYLLHVYLAVRRWVQLGI